MSGSTTKVTVSVVTEDLDTVDAVARALGLTRSAVFNALIHQTLTREQNRIASTIIQDTEARTRRRTKASRGEIDALIFGTDEES